MAWRRQAALAATATSARHGRRRRRVAQLAALAMVGTVVGTVVAAVVDTAPPAAAALNSYSQTFTGLSCVTNGNTHTSTWGSTPQAEAGAVSVTFTIIGGGGAGGDSPAGSGGTGGKGATISATYPISAGQRVWAKIGCGGSDSDSYGDWANRRANGFIRGGAAEDTGGGGGGGATGICIGSDSADCNGGTMVAIAGGGGGGGKGSGTGTCPDRNAGPGGDGGTTNSASNGGGTGYAGTAGSSGGSRGGKGGTNAGVGGAKGTGNGDGADGLTAETPPDPTPFDNDANGRGANGNNDITGGGGGGGWGSGGGGAGGTDPVCAGLDKAREGGSGGGGGSWVKTGATGVSASITAGTSNACGTTWSTSYSNYGAGATGGLRGCHGNVTVSFNYSYSQLAWSTDISTPQTALTNFPDFKLQMRDYTGAAVSGESIGTVTATINPGSGCAGSWSTAPSSSAAGSLITLSGAQVGSSCTNTSTVTVSVVNPLTGATVTSPASNPFTVNKKAQTITFTSSNPGTKDAGQTYNPTATATSGLTVTFSVSGWCTYSNPTVTFTGSGSCTISANQAGNGAWAAATTVTQVVSVRGLTSTAMVCTPNDITLGVGGQTSTCTVTVTDISAVKTNPSGTMTIAQSPSGGTLGTGCTTPGLVASGSDAATCSFTFTSTTPQTYSFTATLASSSSWVGSSVSGVTVRFANNTSTAIACTPARTAYNNTATCVITVTDTGTTTATPVGNATFTKVEGDGTENPSPNGSCTLGGSGASASCSFTYSSPTKDTYKFNASYGGGVKHNASGPAQGSFSIANRSTQITGTCSPNVIATGATTTCTFNVLDTDLEAPGSKVRPTGTVSVTVASGASPQTPTCTLVDDTPAGQSTCSIVFDSGPANGSLKVVSMYFQGGTGGNQHRSSSGFTSFNVTGTPTAPRRSTSSTISCTQTNVPVGNNQTCTVTVTDTAAGSPVTPVGIVNLYTSGGASPSVGTCNLAQQTVGVATCSLSITAQLPKASKATHAFYTGTITHSGSGTPGSFMWWAT